MSDQPTAALMIRYRVADFDKWKEVFDDHEGDRIGAGIVAHHINRAEDDPNSLAVYLAVGDIDKARAYAQSDELRQYMQDGGIIGTPEATWMRPVLEAAVWDRELPAMIVSHAVADFDRWLAGYNAADEMRADAGIVGHAVNQALDDPSYVVVYHQAESFEALHEMAASNELKGAMEAAGVTSAPEFAFVIGGWGKRY